MAAPRTPTPPRPAPPATPALVRAGRSLWRAVSWHRRTLAVLAAVIAVATGLSAARPAAPPGRAVLVAAHALPGGTRLTGADLTSRSLPVTSVPDHALSDPADLVGRTLVGPVTAGTVLTTADILGPALPRSRPGDVIASVPLADATLVSQLAVGDLVDVLATTPTAGAPDSSSQRARVVAAGARLVTVPSTPASGPLGGSSGSSGTVVLVEVDAQTAARLAQAAAAGPLSIVLR